MKLTASNLKRLTQLVYAEAQSGLNEVDEDALASMRKGYYDISTEIGRKLSKLDEAVFSLGLEAMKLPTYARRRRT